MIDSTNPRVGLQEKERETKYIKYSVPGFMYVIGIESINCKVYCCAANEHTNMCTKKLT